MMTMRLVKKDDVKPGKPRMYKADGKWIVRFEYGEVTIRNMDGVMPTVAQMDTFIKLLESET